VLASACSGSDQPSRAGGTQIVRERDFHIAAPARLSAGEVTLTVDNEGPDAHELIVVRADSDHLPLRSDGLTVDEEGLGNVVVGGLEPGRPNSVRTLRLDLTPGRYVFLCNMAGHYLGGMHTTVVVS
jgi:uncharacterized cupredoxin-like copper-binding protein